MITEIDKCITRHKTSACATLLYLEKMVFQSEMYIVGLLINIDGFNVCKFSSDRRGEFSLLRLYRVLIGKGKKTVR